MKDGRRRAVAVAVLLSSALVAAHSLRAEPAGKTSESRLPAVHLDGTYFTRDGKRFIPVGAHWVPAKAAMQWPTRWDPKDIEADFAKMHELGYSLVRFDLLWAWFEPRPGDYNPAAFEQLDFLVSLAHRYRIYLHPSLFIGGEVGEAWWDVPWRHGRNPHADPDMLRLETNHAAELGRRYANETAIIAWDLTDEPPFWIVGGQTTDAAAINWTRLITWGLHRHDRLHPIVVGTSGQDTGHGPFRADDIAADVDFLSVHPFTLYEQDLFPDPLLSQRGTYGAAFEIALATGAGKPAMIHEMGASSAQYAPERIALYDRANMYSGLAAGSIGVDLWCYTDAAPEQRRKVPYLRTPQETQWGMTTWDRQDKPLAREFRKFSRVVAQLDLADLQPAPAEAAILVPEEWAKPHGDFSRLGLTGPEVIPYVSTADGDAVPGVRQGSGGSESTWLMGSALSAFILARQAGLKADFPREHGGWEKRPILLLPSPLTSTGTPFLTHVHSDFYERARKYVEAGGFLYASVAADAAIPDMEALFGASLVDSAVVSEVTLKMVAPLGALKPGDTFRFAVPGASPRYWGSLLDVRSGEVVAVDQDGRPALVTHTLGAGKTLLSAYPLETWLASTPSAFENADRTHLLYEAFREWAGVQPLFRTDHPSVEATVLRGASRGYAILVNHSAERRTVTVATTLPIQGLRQIAPDAARSLALQGSSWQVEIDPYDAVVAEWK
jgi:endo-1,4-beta-mannosidase